MRNETMNENQRVIYFAGSVSYGGGYRSLLFDENVMSDECHGRSALRNTTLDIVYGGPTALGCDHGCTHGAATHGAGYGCGSLREDVTVTNNPRLLVNRCLQQIRESDGVFAYIDSLDCFGTLAEIGYASAMRKPVQIIIDEALRAAVEVWDGNSEGHSLNHDLVRNELWFIFNLPGVRWRYGLVPDFDETIFHRKVAGEQLVGTQMVQGMETELHRLRGVLSYLEKETCRIADRGSAMWRELLTAVIVKPIREALDK